MYLNNTNPYVAKPWKDILVSYELSTPYTPTKKKQLPKQNPLGQVPLGPSQHYWCNKDKDSGQRQ